MNEPHLITEQPRVDALCREWRRVGVFAFDTEFIRDETYDAHLCLIQAANAEGVVELLDPTAGIDLAPFWDLVTDPRVLKIIHAGKEDFDVCLRTCGRPPRNVFDVQIAAGFVGYGYPLSLSRMCESVLRKHIAKAQTLTDWSRRPLTSDQLLYAVEDVAHLPKLHAKLHAQLEKRGRCSWAAEEFARFEDPVFYRPPVQERTLKLKGSKKLDALGLLVLAKLVDWRDSWAQEKNRPVRAMIRDDVLVEISRRRPKRESELEVLRGFPQSRNPRIIRELLDIIEDARQTPRSEWPEPFDLKEETPMMKVAVDILSAVTRAICHEEDVSKDLVGSTQRLRDLLNHLEEPGDGLPALLAGWRGEFVGKRLLDLLEGRCELLFSGWPKKPHLEIRTRDA